MASLQTMAYVNARRLGTRFFSTARSTEIAELAPTIARHLFPVDGKLAWKPTSSGRLTNTGFLDDYFIKISRQGFFPDNIRPSTYFATAGIKYGLPFIPPIMAKDGRLFSEVPDIIGGIKLPQYLRGSTVTLSPKVTIPKPFNKSDFDQHLIREILGKHTAEYTRLNGYEKILARKGLTAPDPLTIDILKKSLSRTFGLAGDSLSQMTSNQINTHAKQCAANLGSDKISQAFATSLSNGFLAEIYNQLCAVEKTFLESAHILPKGLMPLDIKENNFFWKIVTTPDRIAPSPAIAWAFDLDWTAYCERVKSLGRTIGFNAFAGGDVKPEFLRAIIEGYTKEAPMNNSEAEMLPHYISLASIISAVVRASYFAETLQGKEEQYAIDRLNPGVHLTEIKSLKALSYNCITHFAKEISDSNIEARKYIENKLRKEGKSEAGRGL